MLKHILSEVQRIKTLMGINESEYDVLNTDTIEPIEDCNYYDKLSPPNGVDFWFQEKFKLMSSEDKTKIKETINSYINEELNKVVGYYTDYYGTGDGLIKLKSNFVISDDKENEINKLLSYIKSTKYTIIWQKNDTPSQFINVINAWAFTQGNNVYINLFNFWDGTAAGKKSMYDTLLHEVGHVIHNFMLGNPQSFKSPFYEVGNTTQISNNPSLKVELGKKEIHAYLQSFRQLFNIKPFDKGENIVNIIKENVDNGNIKWVLGDLKVVNNNLIFLQKNKEGEYININANNADGFINLLMYNLTIKTDVQTTEEHWADTTFLFSNFVKFNLSDLLLPDITPNVNVGYVDLTSIGNINYDFAQNFENNSEKTFG